MAIRSALLSGCRILLTSRQEFSIFELSQIGFGLFLSTSVYNNDLNLSIKTPKYYGAISVGTVESLANESAFLACTSDWIICDHPVFKNNFDIIIEIGSGIKVLKGSFPVKLSSTDSWLYNVITMEQFDTLFRFNTDLFELITHNIVTVSELESRGMTRRDLMLLQKIAELNGLSLSFSNGCLSCCCCCC
ncbi:hypothetical protein RCL1_003663 [Eukaryota sp. TZLM3-RCL]